MTVSGLTIHCFVADEGDLLRNWMTVPKACWAWRWGCLLICWLGIGNSLAVSQVPADLPWYDPQHESVVPVDLNDRQGADSLDRADIPQVNPNRNGSNGTWRGTSPWTNSGSWFSILIWLGFGTLLAILVIVLLWAFFRAESRKYDTAESQSRRSVEDSIQQLPFELEAGTGDFRRLAEQAYRAGDLRQAVIYLFSHVLVSLDQADRVRLRKGKTNRQYLQELQSSPRLADFYRSVMVPFEETFFGDRVVDAGAFDQCWNELDQFHARLAAPVGMDSDG